ncbi:MAG: M50 family metallopeptidase [Mariniblastus sp.]
MNDSLEDLTAYHESGHALVAILVGARVKALTISPDYDDGPNRFGEAQVEWPAGTYSKKEFAKNNIFVCLAGPVAEMIFRSEPFHPATVPEWSSDWNEAWEIAESLVPDKSKRMAFLEQTTRDLHEILSREQHWAALAALVDNLQAHEWLEWEEIEDIVSAWI